MTSELTLTLTPTLTLTLTDWHLGTQAHTPGHAGDDTANSAEVS